MAKNTPRQPEKISADCPHCGFSQLESAYAKSTFCRKCGEHYSIEKLLLKETESLKGPSLFDKLSKMLGRETVREVACLSCKHRQQISSAAQSSLCPACGSYIDLRDFKIAGPFGRTIQTQGEVVITSKGDASSTRIVCREALVEGQVRGTLTSTGAVRVKMRGKMLGSIEAHQLIIEKRADVEFIRPLKVNSMEVNGKVSARVVCESHVTINKNGYLEGTVFAKAINVERGGVFSGELFIGSQEMEQAELLGEGRRSGLFGGEGLQPA
ncbi:MAG TPA: polymer-forming cytoskeletal protein [Chthoniobacteraceae bacterium]|nr:polymer-forming cytoskeletal protein [Chthoniobacteraceae bacterium]